MTEDKINTEAKRLCIALGLDPLLAVEPSEGALTPKEREFRGKALDEWHDAPIEQWRNWRWQAAVNLASRLD